MTEHFYDTMSEILTSKDGTHGLWVGGFGAASNFENLAQKGIKTVISFGDPGESLNWQTEALAAIGATHTKIEL